MNHRLWHQYQRDQQQRLATFDRIDLTKEEGYLMRLAIFSANLSCFLPNLPRQHHAELFAENLRHVALETADRTLPHLADISDIEGQGLSFCKPSQPSIFVSFHLGSYRLLATYLFVQGYDLAILVRQEVFQQEHEAIMA
ncbi:MAG: hypothetical protein ACK4GN_17725, partial [Runella sp.]